MSAAIEGHDLKRYYEVKGEGFFAQPSILKAVDGASFSLESGKTLAIVHSPEAPRRSNQYAGRTRCSTSTSRRRIAVSRGRSLR